MQINRVDAVGRTRRQLEGFLFSNRDKAFKGIL
jgi:hypothetical protein